MKGRYIVTGGVMLGAAGCGQSDNLYFIGDAPGADAAVSTVFGELQPTAMRLHIGEKSSTLRAWATMLHNGVVDERYGPDFNPDCTGEPDKLVTDDSGNRLVSLELIDRVNYSSERGSEREFVAVEHEMTEPINACDLPSEPTDGWMDRFRNETTMTRTRQRVRVNERYSDISDLKIQRFVPRESDGYRQEVAECVATVYNSSDGYDRILRVHVNFTDMSLPQCVEELAARLGVEGTCDDLELPVGETFVKQEIESGDEGLLGRIGQELLAQITALREMSPISSPEGYQPIER